MQRQLSDEEIDKIISEVITELNRKHSLKVTPVYKLKAALANYGVTKLRAAGRVLKVKFYGKLPKDKLIKDIAAALSDKGILLNQLFKLRKEDLSFLLQTAAEGCQEKDIQEFEHYGFAQSIGLLQCYYCGDKLLYVVPDEIRDIIAELLKDGFLEERKRRDELNKYAVAAANLYGVISLDEFVDLFNSHNEMKTDRNEVSCKLLPYLAAGIGYHIWRDYIAEESFAEDNYDGVIYLLGDRSGKPRYNPSKEELLKYADWDYYEQTPQLEALKKKLDNLLDNEDKVLDVIDEFHDLTIHGAMISKYMDVLNDVGVVFSGIEEANEFIMLMAEMSNNTRIWENYGHTPAELFVEEKKLMHPLPAKPFSFREVGRNELCPCGSGKRYKHCCGKDGKASRTLH